MIGISCSLRCRKALQQFRLVVTEPGAEPRRTVERPAQRAQRVLAQQAGEGDLRINTVALAAPKIPAGARRHMRYFRSEEHTSELQSLMRISYAVFCLKKKNKTQYIIKKPTHKPQSHMKNTH